MLMNVEIKVTWNQFKLNWYKSCLSNKVFIFSLYKVPFLQPVIPPTTCYQLKYHQTNHSSIGSNEVLLLSALWIIKRTPTTSSEIKASSRLANGLTALQPSKDITLTTMVWDIYRPDITKRTWPPCPRSWPWCPFKSFPIDFGIFQWKCPL